MLTYAKEVGYIEHNPARGIRKPADKRRSFRIALKGYRDLGRALEDAERQNEHWQLLQPSDFSQLLDVAVQK